MHFKSWLLPALLANPPHDNGTTLGNAHIENSIKSIISPGVEDAGSHCYKAALHCLPSTLPTVNNLLLLSDLAGSEEVCSLPQHPSCLYITSVNPWLMQIGALPAITSGEES